VLDRVQVDQLANFISKTLHISFESKVFSFAAAKVHLPPSLACLDTWLSFGVGSGFRRQKKDDLGEGQDSSEMVPTFRVAAQLVQGREDVLFASEEDGEIACAAERLQVGLDWRRDAEKYESICVLARGADVDF